MSEMGPGLRDIVREMEAYDYAHGITGPIWIQQTTDPTAAGVGLPVEGQVWPYGLQAGEQGHRFTAVEVRGTCLDPDIRSGEIIIVDLDASPRPGDTVLAVHDGESLVKYLERRNGELYLVALRERPPLKINEDTRILGVVRMVMRPGPRR